MRSLTPRRRQLQTQEVAGLPDYDDVEPHLDSTDAGSRLAAGQVNAHSSDDIRNFWRRDKQQLGSSIRFVLANLRGL